MKESQGKNRQGDIFNYHEDLWPNPSARFPKSELVWRVPTSVLFYEYNFPVLKAQL